MIILSLIAISSLHASATSMGANKPICDANAVTRNCQFFADRKDQAKIKLPDGSFILNPMAAASTTSPYSDVLTGAGLGGYGNYASVSSEEFEAFQVNQAEIMDLLPQGVFTTRFKMIFASFAGSLAANPTIDFTLPWPPNSKTPKSTAVTGTQVFTYAKSKMSAKDFAQLMKLVEVQKAPQVKAALDFQRQQQEQMALMQKRQEEAQVETQRLQTRKTRIREIFKYVQEQMITLVRQGKKEADLSEEQQKQITKLQTTQLHDLDDSSVAVSSTCTASFQNNAYYSPGSHELSICPGYFNKSDAAIASTIAHELGHSIDVCNFQMPLWNVHPDKKTNFANRKDLTDADREALEYLKYFGGKMINFDLKASFPDPASVGKMVQSGLLTEAVAPSSYKKYPQIKEFECLSSSANFRINDASDIIATKRAFNRGASEMPAEKRRDLEKIVQRYGQALDSYPQCYGTLKGAPESQEITADLYGALILEKYLMDHPPKNEEEKVASVESWVISTCTAQGVAAVTQISPEKITPQVFSQYLNSSGRLEAHPEATERLKHTYLNLPGMAKIFDCQRSAKTCMDHLSFYSRSGGSSQKSSNGNKTQEGVR